MSKHYLDAAVRGRTKYDGVELPGWETILALFETTEELYTEVIGQNVLRSAIIYRPAALRSLKDKLGDEHFRKAVRQTDSTHSLLILAAQFYGGNELDALIDLLYPTDEAVKEALEQKDSTGSPPLHSALITAFRMDSVGVFRGIFDSIPYSARMAAVTQIKIEHTNHTLLGELGSLGANPHKSYTFFEILGVIINADLSVIEFFCQQLPGSFERILCKRILDILCKQTNLVSTDTPVNQCLAMLENYASTKYSRCYTFFTRHHQREAIELTKTIQNKQCHEARVILFREYEKIMMDAKSNIGGHYAATLLASLILLNNSAQNSQPFNYEQTSGVDISH